MAESVAKRVAAMASSRDVRELRPLLLALVKENTALRASIAAITAKLDADSGVAGTDYAATCNPPAAAITE